ncbi:MAG TPA: hypothetical protein VGP26_01515 [Actinophytocola sp.]|jgi:hypothetical protein|nr:hypothetical protein [Actinophytocola sp.]
MADDPSVPDVSFTVARHGYERTQVRAHLRALTEHVQRADADAAEARQQVAELQGELEIARREVGALSERLDAFGRPDAETEESSARLLEVAKSQAKEMTTRARAAAEDSWAAAEKASSELRERYRKMLAELDSQHAEIHATHKSIITTTREQADELTTVAERRRRELDAAAERDRVRIDREFSESVTARRASLERELTHRRDSVMSEVDAKLRAADEEAQNRIATVKDQVKRLTEVRTELSERLRGTQELLARSVDLLKPAESEDELTEQDPFPMPDAPRAEIQDAPAEPPAGPPVDPPTQVRMRAVSPPTKIMASVEPPSGPATEPPTVPATEPAEKPDPAAEADKNWKPQPPARGNGKRVPPPRTRRTQPAKSARPR